MATGYYYTQVITSTIPGGPAQRGDPNTKPGLCTTCDSQSDLTTTALASLLIKEDTTDGVDNISNINFGYTQSQAVFGGVWRDYNANGTWDASEVGFASVSVSLYQSNCSTLATATTNPVTTDSSGNYLFTGVAVGNYCVKITIPSGYSQTGESDGSVNNQISFNVASGGFAGPYNFGLQVSGNSTLGDTIFWDWDGDGLQGTGAPDTVNATGTHSINASTRTLTATGAFTSAVANQWVNLSGYANATNNGWFQIQSVTNSNSVVLLDPRGYLVTETGSGDERVKSKKTTIDGGIPNVTVRLYRDLDADGLIDPTDPIIATKTTDASGQYLFTGLGATQYVVEVDTSSSGFALGTPKQTADPHEPGVTCANCDNQSIQVANGTTNYLFHDFGYKPSNGSAQIGDTVYWDVNTDGQQGGNEPGITGVTLKLYKDTNGNGLLDYTDTNSNGMYDANETGELFIASQVTDSSGVYLFTGLPGDSSGQKYVVAVQTTGTPLTVNSTTASQSADPEADGVNCKGNATLCNGQGKATLYTGTSYMGADFGYDPTGVTNTLGDYLWLDSDRDGVQDANEAGIPYVEIRVTGPNCAPCSVQTDANGRYVFTGLSDGTYSVSVYTADPDFPGGLAATYDKDGTPDGSTANISLSGSQSNLTIDFGYGYSGSTSLSGTICRDNPASLDGLCNSTNDSGVSNSETALSTIPVYLYLWNDTANPGVIDSGETVRVAQTDTDSQGDYSFTAIPSGKYLITTSMPLDNLELTTTSATANHPADTVGKTPTTAGQPTLSAYAITPTVAGSNPDYDFAYKPTLSYDYGDMPDNFGTSYSQDGARHIVSGSPSLYLGGMPDTENDALPSPTASTDGADEDGVTFNNPGNWTTTGSVTVNVNGSGWLVAWIDFNGDGSFAGTGEMIISQAVTTNPSQTINFNIPAGGVTNASGYARFRLFPEQPIIPSIAYVGEASSGEVEDYVVAIGGGVSGSLGDRVWDDVDGDGVQDAGEPGLTGVTVFLDFNNNGLLDSGESSTATGTDGAYSFGGLPVGSYTVRVVTSTLTAGYTRTYDQDGIASADVATISLTSVLRNRTDVDFGYRPPRLRIQKAASISQASVGLPFTYTLTLTNSGGTASPVQVIDYVPSGIKLVGTSLPSGWTCAPALPVQGGTGKTLTCTLANPFLANSTQTLGLTAIPTAIKGPLTNRAAITGDSDTPDITSSGCNGTEPKNCGKVAITPRNPGIELFKQVQLLPANETVTQNGRIQADEKLSYTFTISNRGDVPLTAIALYDPQLDSGTLACGPKTSLNADFSLTLNDVNNVLAVNDSVMCTGLHTATAQEATANRAVNVATTSGKAPDGKPVQSTATGIWDNSPQGKQVSLSKIAVLNDNNGNGNFDDTETVSYQFAVRNVGKYSLTSLTISDPLLSAAGISISCPSFTSLAVNAQITCTADQPYILTNADVSALQRTNTATATASRVFNSQTITVRDFDTQVLNSGQPASLEIKNTARLITDTAPTGLSVGDTLRYSLVVTNTGAAALTNVQVSDSKDGLNLTCSPKLGSSLSSGSRMSCTGDYVIRTGEAGPIENIARASAKPVGRYTLLYAASDYLLAYDAPTPSTYSLGGQVWLDSDNNGILNLGEVGIDNVKLRLLQCETATSICNTAPDTSDQTTAGGGLYRFAPVAKHPDGYTYRVQVLVDNFKADVVNGTQALYGALSSAVDDATPFTSGTTWPDNYDQGIGTAANVNLGIQSRTFDLNNLVSTTRYDGLDFGFLKKSLAAPPDLVVVGSLSALTVPVNGSFTYTLEASNAVGNGDLSRIPIVLATLPTGMTVTGSATTITATDWTCTVASTRASVNCKYSGELPVLGGGDIGGAITIPVTVSAGAKTCGNPTCPATVRASITQLTGEPNYTNNKVSLSVTVQ